MTLSKAFHGPPALYTMYIIQSILALICQSFSPFICNRPGPSVLISFIQYKGKHKIDCVMNLWACNQKLLWSIVLSIDSVSKNIALERFCCLISWTDHSLQFYCVTITKVCLVCVARFQRTHCLVHFSDIYVIVAPGSTPRIWNIIRLK